jgi:hypothetical protein
MALERMIHSKDREAGIEEIISRMQSHVIWHRGFLWRFADREKEVKDIVSGGGHCCERQNHHPI